MTSYNYQTDTVTETKSGTGWTIDVTACNLSTHLAVKDFLVYVDDSLVSNTNLEKTSRTLLTYTGASIPSSTVVVRRHTSLTSFQPVTYTGSLPSTLWNGLVETVMRTATEYDQWGVGPDAVANGVSISNSPYSATWETDTVNGASRAALYDVLSTYVSSISPVLTGTPTAPTASPGTNNTQIATTEYVDSTFAPLASPNLTGSPTSVTPATSNSSTRIATTAHVHANKALTDANVATNTSNIATNTSAIATNTSDIASHESSITALQDGMLVAEDAALTGAPTSTTPDLDNSSTRIATTEYVQHQYEMAYIEMEASSGTRTESTWISDGFSQSGTCVTYHTNSDVIEAESGDGTTNSHRLTLKQKGIYRISVASHAALKGVDNHYFTYQARVYDSSNIAVIGPEMVNAQNCDYDARHSNVQTLPICYDFTYVKSNDADQVLELQGYYYTATLGTGGKRHLQYGRLTAELVKPLA